MQQAKPEEMRVQSAKEGLHLKHSILWFDAASEGQLSFLSSATELNKAITMKVIATEETTKVLETFGIRPNCLVCQYNRPFSLGKLSMELLPSGHCLGGALLYVESDFGPLLYAPAVQEQRIPIYRSMQLRKAETLVLRADYPLLKKNHRNRQKEKERLIQSIEAWAKTDIWPQIFCASIPIAQELCSLFSERGIEPVVHPSIYKINKIYEKYGVDLGAYSALNAFRRSQKKVIIYPISYAKKHRHLMLSSRPSFFVQDYESDATKPSFFSQHQESFYLNQSTFGHDLETVISQVSPKEIYFFGFYAKDYAKAFEGRASKISALFPNDQPTLF